MVTTGGGIELSTSTPQAAITDATDTSASDQSAPINAIILALERAGIITPN